MNFCSGLSSLTISSGAGRRLKGGFSRSTAPPNLARDYWFDYL